MAEKRITLRRTAFRAWLAAQEPGAEVGERQAARRCPLARFLEIRGALRPAVTHYYYTADEAGGLRPPRNLSDWAREFVWRTDDDGVGPVTAAAALAVLESIGP
jgi:hypothetical protein